MFQTFLIFEKQAKARSCGRLFLRSLVLAVARSSGHSLLRSLVIVVARCSSHSLLRSLVVAVARCCSPSLKSQQSLTTNKFLIFSLADKYQIYGIQYHR